MGGAGQGPGLCEVIFFSAVASHSRPLPGSQTQPWQHRLHWKGPVYSVKQMNTNLFPFMIEFFPGERITAVWHLTIFCHYSCRDFSKVLAHFLQLGMTCSLFQKASLFLAHQSRTGQRGSGLSSLQLNPISLLVEFHYPSLVHYIFLSLFCVQTQSIRMNGNFMYSYFLQHLPFLSQLARTTLEA